jgi:recombinational DNA repair ATPase RecF
LLLTEFQVQKFRNTLDSSPIPVDKEVTCLVGKNESGKTALLQSLYRLKPAYADKFDLDEQYPRWIKSRDVKSVHGDEK